ncbi:6136_t:CDS:2, partial [Rhizophagus irregularis]
MAEWTDPEIRTLIDKRRTRNDEFHNLGRNRKRFWSLPKIQSRESGNIMPSPSSREVERELRSSERR